MKTKKLKNLVKKVKTELTWPIMEISSQKSGNFRVASDPKERSHSILVPADKSSSDPFKVLIYLHELGHATLCERYDPIFAGNFPVVCDDQKVVAEASPALNAASDWFVGHWFMEICVDEAIEDLRDELRITEELLGREQTPNPSDFCVSAMVIAQAIKYLKEPIECGGILKDAVDAFLAVPPEKPSAENYEVLANGLLAKFSTLRGRVVTEDGHTAWHFSTPDTDKK